MKKIIIALSLLIAFSFNNSFAEVNDKNWVKTCAKEDKTACLIGIKQTAKLEAYKEKQDVNAYIQIGKNTTQESKVIDEKEKIVKIVDVVTEVPVLFFNLPFDSDLRRKPLVRADKTNIANVEFMHCNKSVGCKTMVVINEEAIKIMEDANELGITFAVFGTNQQLEIVFPLKGFKKAYSKLKS
jgi:invasion protein IalB